nr:tetratricopeptide repeat protein [Anaerolineales bacterium]
MTTSPTPHLLAVLPEALWGEAIRRLRRTPVLWALAADPAVAAVFASLKPDPHLWQPGRLALAVYAARHPETEGAAEAWLLGPGRDRLAAAYMRLLSAEPALDPIDDALPAALALRLRGQATTDWHAIAAEAVTQPDRWRLPLQYVAGLDATPEALLRGLLESTPAGAALAADCLTANFSTEAGFALLAGAGGAAPAAHWLALGRRLKALGAAPLARRLLARASEDAPRPVNPAGDPQLTAALADHALLVAGGDDFTAAHPALVEAWTAVRGLRAEIAGQIALLAAAAGAPSVALAAYQDALSDRPTEAAYTLGLARAYLDLNEPAQALAALASVTEDPRAPALVARAQFAAGDLPAARAALEALDTTALTQPAELTETADILQLTGQPAAAGRCRQAAAERAGLDPALHLAAARALADQNAWPEAVAAAQEAAALAPADPEARELLGQTLLAAGQAAAALPHFQSALTYQPERVTAGLGLAQAALTAGQPERALEAARRTLTLTPAAAPQGEAHVLMGQALAQLQRHPEAFEHFCQASALVPHAPGPWRAMAHYHRSQGEAAQAIQALEAGRQALKLADSPALAPVLLDLADAYLALERPDEALSVLREAGAADPMEPEAHRQLGQLLVQLRQPDEAAAALRRALDLRPGDWRALHLLGQALESGQRTAEAWAAYQQATLARPAAPAPYFDLGRLTLALHARGVADATPRQAVAALGEAARLAPEDADAHGLLAQAQQ